jgi:crotonobetainyl-CoA:carnitine CoA-transferase CaiB-like acyl-CoA transferase
MPNALEGIRVLDLTRLLPGAEATQYLADFGADVIKIEQPGAGDYGRTLFAATGENPVFAATNRGKRSVCLDLKAPDGRDAFIRLAREADVLVESFRPGVMDRLQVGYETLRAHNKRLIYAALTGYGQDGPMRDAAGHDLNYLAMAGALDLNGDASCAPVVPNFQIADLAGGAMQTAMGILLALLARERTGEGQFVDVSMTRGAAGMLTIAFAQFAATKRGMSSGQGILGGRYACYSVYRCRDGRWIAVGALEPKFWATLCRALNREDLIIRQYAPEPEQPDLRGELAAVFEQRDAADWVHELGSLDCCVTMVRTVEEAAACEWLRVNEPAPRLSATTGVRSPTAPKLGQHTHEVLMTKEQTA